MKEIVWEKKVLFDLNICISKKRKHTAQKLRDNEDTGTVGFLLCKEQHLVIDLKRVIMWKKMNKNEWLLKIIKFLFNLCFVCSMLVRFLTNSFCKVLDSAHNFQKSMFLEEKKMSK